MFKSHILFLFMVSTFIFTGLSMQMTFSQDSFRATNQKDYAQYLKFMLGSNSFNEEIGTNLKQFIIQNKVSIFDAVEEIIIILSEKKSEIQTAMNNFEISEDFISTIKSEVNRITIINMKEANDEEINKKKMDLEQQGKKYHCMRGSSKQIQFVENMFAKHHKVRMLQQAQEDEEQNSQENENTNQNNKDSQDTNQGKKQAKSNVNAQISPSYLIKFFFIIIFLLVCLGTLLAIANMQNTKDTLLYAKFIADVGR